MGQPIQVRREVPLRTVIAWYWSSALLTVMHNASDSTGSSTSVVYTGPNTRVEYMEGFGFNIFKLVSLFDYGNNYDEISYSLFEFKESK